MSKIICDVCGTSYPDTATQCPICGCVRPSDVSAVPGEPIGTETEQTGTYTHVKGGRFSKANVRKRNEGQHLEEEQPLEEYEAMTPPQRRKTNHNDIGLVIAICVLLLSIVAVVIYISTQFFGNFATQEPTYAVTETTEAVTTEDTIPVVTDISCESVLVSKTSVTLTAVGETCQLSATCNPADTTDELVYSTADDLIATVTADGVITAVSAGETEILVTCGSAYAVCRVTCDIPEEDTTPVTEEVVEGDVEVDAPVEEEAAATYKINKKDVKLWLNLEDHQKSFTLTLKDSNGKVMDVDWKVKNPSICKVSGNKVTALSVGDTKISVDYEGVTYECIVRVREA